MFILDKLKMRPFYGSNYPVEDEKDFIKPQCEQEKQQHLKNHKIGPNQLRHHRLSLVRSQVHRLIWQQLKQQLKDPVSRDSPHFASNFVLKKPNGKGFIIVATDYIYWAEPKPPEENNQRYCAYDSIPEPLIPYFWFKHDEVQFKRTNKSQLRKEKFLEKFRFKYKHNKIFCPDCSEKVYLIDLPIHQKIGCSFKSNINFKTAIYVKASSKDNVENETVHCNESRIDIRRCHCYFFDNIRFSNLI